MSTQWTKECVADCVTAIISVAVIMLCTTIIHHAFAGKWLWEYRWSDLPTAMRGFAALVSFWSLPSLVLLGLAAWVDRK